MSDFRFYISGARVQENPDGWDTLTTTLRRDKGLKGIFSIMDVSLTFYEDGFDMINQAMDTVGFCGSLSIEILESLDGQNYVRLYSGLIPLKEVVIQRGIEGRFAKCKIDDNSFFSSIMNNKNIKTRPYVGTSKNEQSISPAAYNTIKFFRPANGVYYSHRSGVRNDTAFLVYDLLRFFIDFMTDRSVGFASDTFGPGGVYEGTMVTRGKVVRFANSADMDQASFEDEFPEFSFSELYENIDKKYNIGFIVQNDNGGRPVFRVEKMDYFFQNNTLLNLPGVDKFTTKVASEYLYARILLGSSEINNDPLLGLSFSENIRFVGFKEEEYLIQGKCNFDNALDLQTDWVISSNVIEDLILNGGGSAPTNLDNTLFLISSVFDTEWLALGTNWVGTAPPYFYNEAFINSVVINRFFGAVPNSIATYLGTTDNSFLAERSFTDPFYFGSGNDPELIINCDNEISDPNNNYDPSGFFYTIPNSGVYTFSGLLKMLVLNISGTVTVSPKITLFIKRYTSSNVFISSTTIFSTTIVIPPNGSTTIDQTGNASTNADSGDKIYLFVLVENFLVNYKRLIGCRFSCTSVSDGGGVYASFDPNDLPIFIHELTHPIEAQSFRTTVQDPRGFVFFGIDQDKQYKAWIQEIKYNHFTGEGKCQLLSSKNLNL